MTIAIYPGSFDPITNGHLDIVTRAARLFEKVIIGVYERPNKHLLFTAEERVDLARRTVVNLANVEVRSFSGLAIGFAKQEKAQAMIRGLRMSADFEREFEMASQEYQFLSSSLLKEVACLEGNINDLVPEHVAKALRKKVHSEM